MPPRRTVPLLLAALACAAAAGCAASAESSAAPAPLEGTEWALTELEGRAPPPGDAGRPATLLLRDGRVNGFAGCNSFFGGYTVDGAALRFSELGATRKACATGMELESRYLAALEAVRAYRLTPQGLELRGDTTMVARFTARPPNGP